MFTFTTMQEAEEHLAQALSSERFLESAGNFSSSSSFIAPYPASLAGSEAQTVAKLAGDLAAKGVRAATADAFGLAVEILDEQGDWDWLVEEEHEVTPRELAEDLCCAVDVEGALVPRIEERAQGGGAQLLIVHGMGACWPFLRTHQLLTLLNPGVPVLVMFPGSYSQLPDGTTSLDALDTPPGEGGGHYRARNIFDL